MLVKLCAVLACAESGLNAVLSTFGLWKFHLLTPPNVCLHVVRPHSVSLRRVTYFANMLVQKQIFQQNHFSLFIRGPGELDS